MLSSTITLKVERMYAAEVAEIIHKRLLVLNYEHEITVDEPSPESDDSRVSESEQIEQAIARELAMAMDSEPEEVPSPHAFDVVA